MCDVPSIAVFCSESIERFPGITSKFFLKLLVTIQVASIITGLLLLLLLLLLYRNYISINQIHNSITQSPFHMPFQQKESPYSSRCLLTFNPLSPELNPICYLLALLGAHHFLHVSRIRVKSLTLR